MIAGRRDRRRSLIRSNTMTSAMARNLSTRNDVAAFQTGSISETGYTASGSPFTMSASRLEMTMYLRQLSRLHAAGILSDDEFHSARGRLLGS